MDGRHHVANGRQCFLGWMEHLPEHNPNQQDDQKRRSRNKSPRQAAERAARRSADFNGLDAHLRSTPQRATVKFSIGCISRRSTMT